MDAKTDTAPIEVLEDLLASRFSCRAFKPDPVPRATIERILAAAQKNRVVVQQPAVAIGDRLGCGNEKVSRCDVRCRLQRQAEQRRFSVPARISRRLSRAPPRKRLSTLQLARHPPGDKAAYARQALENFNFFGAPHVAIVHTD